MAQWKPRKKFKRLRQGKDLSDEPSDTKNRKPSTKEEMDNQDEEDSKRHKPGELLSCDNVGPISPKSFEGYIQSFIRRDTCIKRMFSHSDSEASEDVYLEGLEQVRQYYRQRGIRIRTIRTDDFTTFKSRKVREYYAKHAVEHTVSALVELSRAGYSDNYTQHISCRTRIATHARRLLEPRTQALD